MFIGRALFADLLVLRWIVLSPLFSSETRKRTFKNPDGSILKLLGCFFETSCHFLLRVLLGEDAVVVILVGSTDFLNLKVIMNCCNEPGMFHCTYQGLTFQNQYVLRSSADPDLGSGFSPFAKVFRAFRGIQATKG